MTLAEFKAQHPALAAEHATEVLAAEKDRAGAWLVFQDVDAAAVKAGLESGLPIGQKQMAEFALKAQSKNAATAIENDGAENEGVKTPESKVEGQEEKAELDALKKEIKANAKQLLQLQ